MRKTRGKCTLNNVKLALNCSSYLLTIEKLHNIVSGSTKMNGANWWH
jgi:hypothetical protein